MEHGRRFETGRPTGRSASSFEPGRRLLPAHGRIVLAGRGAFSEHRVLEGRGGRLVGGAGREPLVARPLARADEAKGLPSAKLIRASQRRALERILATFTDPRLDAGLRTLVTEKLRSFTDVPGERFAREALGPEEVRRVQTEALEHVLGTFRDPALDTPLRRAVIEKIGWVGDETSVEVLERHVRFGSPEEMQAARGARDALAQRGALRPTERSTHDGGRAEALRMILESFRDSGQDAAIRRAATDVLAGQPASDSPMVLLPEGLSPEQLRTIQRDALHRVLDTSTDAWSEGPLRLAVIEKIGWLGDGTSLGPLARIAHVGPDEHRAAAYGAIRRLWDRGVFVRTNRAPDRFGERPEGERTAWLFDHGTIVRTEPLGGGVNESFRVTFSARDGAGRAYTAVGAFKPTDGTFQNEVAAYRIAARLFRGEDNAVPYTTEAVVEGRLGSLQGWSCCPSTAFRVSPDVPELSDALVFDRLISNGDRLQRWGDETQQKFSNLLVDPETRRPILIDNGWSFGRGLYQPVLPRRYYQSTVRNLEQMRREAPEMETELLEFLTPGQVREVFRAIDEVLDNVEGKIEARGADTFYR